MGDVTYIYLKIHVITEFQGMFFHLNCNLVLTSTQKKIKKTAQQSPSAESCKFGFMAHLRETAETCLILRRLERFLAARARNLHSP